MKYILIIFILIFIIPYIGMVMWNCVMPQVFGFGEITYWQMVYLYLLIRWLFGVRRWDKVLN